jgi:enoyl-CoA hydratase
MNYENILFEKKEGIAYITINRPNVLNALNAQTLDELRRALIEIKKDDSLGAVIITGSGEKAFIAGADINELAVQTSASGKNFALNGQHIFSMIENLGKPVIAAINGFALGGGCELALACTLRVASENAELGQPEVNLGIIPGYGGTQRLPRLVGTGRAMELILTGGRIDANEAERTGLVNKVVPQSELIETAKVMAKKIMSKGPLAISYGIEAINKGMQMSLQEGLFLEATLFGLLCATEDMKEGTKAFLEKRKASFKGK